MVEIKTQLSVHMENRPGALAELTRVLHDAEVNLLGVAVPDTGEFGTVRMLPGDVMDAKEALQEAGLPHAAVDVLAIELPHRPGSLAQVAALLAEANVVVRYAYATIGKGDDTSLCVVCVDDIHKAQKILSKKLS